MFNCPPHFIITVGKKNLASLSHVVHDTLGVENCPKKKSQFFDQQRVLKVVYCSRFECNKLFSHKIIVGGIIKQLQAKDGG